MNRDNTVLLGMSGGVDSTASAILLKNAGYTVVGATYMLIDDEDFQSSVDDAKKAAKHLGIDHIVVDYRKNFKEYVITNFIDEYLIGHTPNPCVVCNKNIKYGDFLQTADELGIRYIATGQYAKILNRDNRYYIVKSDNIAKDQTYFLYMLKEEMLRRMIFPIGNILNKDYTRQLVKDSGLEIFRKKDSQEICFIKNKKYIDFILENTDKKLKKGKFKDKNGKVLGEHEGIAKYTIGQRKGLGIALGKPQFVVDIDSRDNSVILGDNEDLFSDELKLYDYTYINHEYDKAYNKLTAKIRYAAKEENVEVENKGDYLLVKFEKPVRAITKGQSTVFYDNDILVGGGIIK